MIWLPRGADNLEMLADVAPSAAEELDHDSIRQHLTLILESAPFRNSKRYKSLLRYVVELTLESRSAQLKERTIGVEVFGRKPDYDTSIDPVVRIAAGEVRRRLAQYYDSCEVKAKVRIDLLPGSYIPRIRKLTSNERVEDKGGISWHHSFRLFRWCFRPSECLIGAVGVLAIIALGASYASTSIGHSQSPFDRFWNVVWGPTKSVLLCVGESDSMKAGQPTTTHELLKNETVIWADSVTISRFSALAQGKQRSFGIRFARETTRSDLDKQAAILVGGFNNEWIMQRMKHLRFVLHWDYSTDTGAIVDTWHSGPSAWTAQIRTPYKKLLADYGLITKVADPQTGLVTVIASGIAGFGTIAAGEFLTDPSYLDSFARHAPAGWLRKNMQIVIATALKNGQPGPPQVVAAYFW